MKNLFIDFLVSFAQKFQVYTSSPLISIFLSQLSTCIDVIFFLPRVLEILQVSLLQQLSSLVIQFCQLFDVVFRIYKQQKKSTNIC